MPDISSSKTFSKRYMLLKVAYNKEAFGADTTTELFTFVVPSNKPINDICFEFEVLIGTVMDKVLELYKEWQKLYSDLNSRRTSESDSILKSKLKRIDLEVRKLKNRLFYNQKVLYHWLLADFYELQKNPGDRGLIVCCDYKFSYTDI